MRPEAASLLNDGRTAELLHLVAARFSDTSLTLRGPDPYGWDQSDFWRHLARRPGMFVGGDSGQHLGWYLAGVQKCGDWLGLPADLEADAIIESIHCASKENYGSEFGVCGVAHFVHALASHFPADFEPDASHYPVQQLSAIVGIRRRYGETVETFPTKELRLRLSSCTGV